MSKPFAVELSPKFVIVVVTLCVLFSGCSVTEKTVAAKKGRDMKALTRIQIDANGPADTVRAFYKRLKEKKFRDKGLFA